jgi:TonB family protein
LQYLTLTPADVATPAKPANTSERRTTPARRSSVSERHGTPSRLVSFKESLGAITDRLAEIRPAIDAADVVNKPDTDNSRWTAVADSEFSKGPSRLSDAVPTMVAQVKNGIYTPDLVDEQVAPRPGNPKPRYPESLRAAGVEGDVNVQFVVDTTGRVDEPSIKFSSHIHELFMDAIRVSLRRARFFPARLAGTVVPQLVQQEFRFELRERP